MHQLQRKDLQRELTELGQRRHVLQDHELFVVWFLLAAVTDDEDAAVRALTGTSGEKGLDALYIDDSARAVFLVQGKYRATLGKHHEQRQDLMAFADLAATLYAGDSDFGIFAADLEANALAKVKQARERLIHRDYRLRCFYATTGRCAAKLAKEAESMVRRLRRPTQKPALEVYDAERVMWLLGNYLAGAAPPIPLLELPVEKETLQEHDPSSNINAWVCSMRGDHVAELFDVAGERLFARNIRGYLGEGKVNEKIRETLNRTPERFWYFNNGITIVCDSAVEERGKDKHVLALTQPQIINGQQTTRVLVEVGRKARKARVPVRIISVPDEVGQVTYEDLVAQIVEATNWQNAITSADLRANDRRQIDIERELGRLGYFYVRKRQAKSEVRGKAPRHMPVIAKEDLMRAGAACLRPNLPLQKGLQKLFEDDYDAIFKRSARSLLSQHALFRECSRIARGSSSRKYGKFIICYRIWDEVAGDLKSSARHELFVSLCGGRGDDAPKMRALIENGFKGLDAYYAGERGSGAKRVEPSNFFKRREVYKGFEAWLESRGARHESRFLRDVERVRAVLKS